MQHVQAPFSGERRRVGGSAAAPQQMGPPTMHIPVFLDRIFRMIENVPDDVVCWSKAGDSFIIKQVRARPERPSRRETRHEEIFSTQLL